ncbi:c-type cytochrome [Rhodoblastus sp.]|uniref:c-type cytochrome n=1 Tax=Rhodoblastus sp. TaxID=1962975 RepID=UPI003F9BFD96
MRRLSSSRSAATVVLVLLAGCSDQSMTVQPKYTTYRPSSLWRDGASARPLPDHTVARGDLLRDEAAATPPPVDAALLARGRERFDIYCSPCHGLGGHGDGMAVQRGFPPPPNFDSPRLRAAPARHFFDVVTHGYGVMYSYAARVEPEDRWTIVAYIRALQASAATPLAEAPEAREELP